MKPCKKCQEGDGYIIIEDSGAAFPCSCEYGQWQVILSKKPRFYVMDISNYNNEFLQEIIIWQDLCLKFLKEKYNIKEGESD